MVLNEMHRERERERESKAYNKKRRWVESGRECLCEIPVPHVPVQCNVKKGGILTGGP
jgi:hypothetical protein